MTQEEKIKKRKKKSKLTIWDIIGEAEECEQLAVHHQCEADEILEMLRGRRLNTEHKEALEQFESYIAYDLLNPKDDR
jgi:hypothetical protein